MNAIEMARAAKLAAIKLRATDPECRKQALLAIASAIRNGRAQIIEANQKDLQAGRDNKLTEAMLDRLELNPERIESMALAVENIANQAEVVGMIESEWVRPDGLVIKKERIPIGVICMIFESRPNVIVDGAALAIKSGNCICLKGGKEAQHSNRLLGNLIRESIKAHIPLEVVTVLDSTDRTAVHQLLEQTQSIDLVIPRGGPGLIKFVVENSQVPVIAHYMGLCHFYIHADADPEQAIKLILNSKTQRTGVCNALETLLLHQAFAPHYQKLFTALEKKGCQLRLDSQLHKTFPQYQPAKDLDWETEYLDNILSVKQVDTLEAAISHIQKYGTHHTEAIATKSEQVIKTFKQQIDCSCLVINASTRFNDGGELGLGAEVGISTSKLHAYGPMGVKELTTCRYVVEGNGHVREN